MTRKDHDKLRECVGRVGRLAARTAGEAELVAALRRLSSADSTS